MYILNFLHNKLRFKKLIFLVKLLFSFCFSCVNYFFLLPFLILKFSLFFIIRKLKVLTISFLQILINFTFFSKFYKISFRKYNNYSTTLLNIIYLKYSQVKLFFLKFNFFIYKLTCDLSQPLITSYKLLLYKVRIRVNNVYSYYYSTKIILDILLKQTIFIFLSVFYILYFFVFVNIIKLLFLLQTKLNFFIKKFIYYFYYFCELFVIFFIYLLNIYYYC